MCSKKCARPGISTGLSKLPALMSIAAALCECVRVCACVCVRACVHARVSMRMINNDFADVIFTLSVDFCDNKIV
jgi:hypothetical protein